MQAASDAGVFGFLRRVDHIVYAWVAVGDAHLGLRIDVVGSPAAAPASQPWDLSTNQPLQVAVWPVGRPVFRPDWSPGNGNAPYLACDRVGLATHPAWATEYPGRAWSPTMTLVDYLRQVHDALRGSILPTNQS